MITKIDKNAVRKARHHRIRRNINGTVQRPRLNVYRSLNNIYAQVIDDVKGNTLVSASSLCKEIAENKGINKSQQAALVGKLIAKRALEEGITNVKFDRSGYLYHGRVKALADAAREAGLKF